jgi:uncharacterized membrane protein YfcA
MKRIWWPEPVYEAKPYGAVTFGVLVATLAFVRSLSMGQWDVVFAAAACLGAVIVVYGGAILRKRMIYRRHSRWNRERRS